MLVTGDTQSFLSGLENTNVTYEDLVGLPIKDADGCLIGHIAEANETTFIAAVTILPLVENVVQSMEVLNES